MFLPVSGIIRWWTAIVFLQFFLTMFVILHPDYLIRLMMLNYRIKSEQFEKTFQRMKKEYLDSHYQNCQRSVVIENDINCMEIIKGKSLSRRIPSNDTRLCNLTRISENCNLFRTINGYNDKFVSQEEKDFPLAFGIRLHTSPHQAEQLLRMIYRPHNFYCLHIDNGSDPYVFKSLSAVANCFDNVVVRSEIRTVYSSIRLIEADLLCMREATKSRVKWKYYMNMAGQEVPIKTNLEMVQICKMLKGNNDVTSIHNKGLLASRMNFHHILGKRRPIKTRLKKAKFNETILFRKGCAYGTFSKDFINFILNSDISKKLLKYLEDTYAPEETFINTLNYMPNAPGGTNISISHAGGIFLSRAMIWTFDRKKCFGKYRHAVCVLDNSALPWLLHQPQLIANKVQTKYDQIIMDCLEEHLFQKTNGIIIAKLNYTMYKKFPHVSITELNKHLKP